ncbi:MAG: hypothetical protein LBL58_12865 [Tannerellaceae bacterium]|jgi:hypothetical protein|nr:hypothetical protein [Tannerellaceae bacterium]
MKVLFIISLCYLSINIFAQEIIPGIVHKMTYADGKDVYVFNNTGIKDYDMSKMNMKERQKTFISIVESLPIFSCPLDINGIFNKIKNYKNLQYFMAKDIFSSVVPNSGRKVSGWLPRDSIYFRNNEYFDYNNQQYGGFVEKHTKVCPLSRIDIDKNYYSILIYTITSECKNIFLNNYSKEGFLISTNEVVYSESFYANEEDIKNSYLRTVIDSDKRIHKIFMGGAATCEKYTMTSDSMGYFHTKKTQVYDWNSVVQSWKEEEILSTIDINQVINFNTGEILKAFINDPDGYTNVREKPDISSSVLFKINKDESFYLIIDLINRDWYAIALYQTKDKSGKIEKSHEDGYIHKSRVRIVPKE